MARATGVILSVLVGAGMIGENCLGLGVSVARSTYASEGTVGVAMLAGELEGMEVVCPVQAVMSAQTTKTIIDRRLIAVKYIEKKLSDDEF